MKRIPAFVLSLVLGLSVSSLPAKEAPTSNDKAPTAQQQKMKDCNADAGKKALKGDDRKKFMSECLSAKKTDEAKGTAQQQKMASCNEDAGKKKLSGDARKSFMSECLKVGKDDKAAATEGKSPDGTKKK